jgi:hypothetical protein
MTNFTVTLAAGAALWGTVVMPGATLAATSNKPSSVQTLANECARERCWKWPSYYDTPPQFRPRIFYGYEPHRHGDWYRYYDGWFGVRGAYARSRRFNHVAEDALPSRAPAADVRTGLRW